MTPDQLERFVAKVQPEPNSGCWIWRGALSGLGYGMMGVGSKLDGTKTVALSHRLSYEHFVGPIPPGMWIDHLCCTKECCNPAHLEAVTPRENLRRAGVVGKESCRNGHKLDDANVYVDRRGNRKCRKCSALQQKNCAIGGKFNDFQ